MKNLRFCIDNDREKIWIHKSTENDLKGRIIAHNEKNSKISDIHGWFLMNNIPAQ